MSQPSITDAAVSLPEKVDRDLQITLAFEDGSEHTFTVLRDRDMRWHGAGTEARLVSIEAAWFYNPPRLQVNGGDDG